MNKKNFSAIFKLVFQSVNVNGIKTKKKAKTNFNNVKFLLLTTFLFYVLFFIQTFLPLINFFIPQTPGVTLDRSVIPTQIATSTFSGLFLVVSAFSFNAVFTSFFLNDDDNYFIHLPISSTKYFLAKFLSALILGCFIGISIPILRFTLSLIFINDISFIGVFNSFAIYIGLSVFIVSFVFLFGMLLNAAFKLKKRKGLSTTIFVIMQFGIILVYFLLNYNVIDIERFSTWFFASDDKMTMLYSLIPVLAAAIFFTISIVIGKLYFIKSLTGAGDGASRIKPLLKKREEKDSVSIDSSSEEEKGQKTINEYVDLKIKKSSSSLFLHIYKNEWLSFFKNISLFLNAFLPYLILCCSSLVTYLVLMSSVNITGLFDKNLFVVFFFALTYIFIIFSNSMCFPACITYSKELQGGKFLFSTPLNQRVNLNAKIFALLSVILPINLIVLVIGIILAELNLIIAFSSIFTFVFIFIASYLLGILIDLRFGNPNADNYVALTKNSKQMILYVLISTCVSIIIVGLPYIVDLIIRTNADFDYDLTYICLCYSSALSLVYFIVTFVLLQKNLNKYLLRFYQR